MGEGDVEMRLVLVKGDGGRERVGLGVWVW